MNKKVCLKSDGTLKKGKKIIDYLKSLGGKNFQELNGASTAFPYYFIRSNKEIELKSYIPKGYTLIKLPKTNQYPKVMLVSDDNKNWYKRVVFMEKCKMFLAWDDAESLEESEKTLDIYFWNHAKDIEPEVKEAIVELTLKDISEGKGVGVPPHLIRIKE